jgi:hypothetical protein
MPKSKQDTSGRPDDPDLAPDAALAEDLGDEDERRKQQLEYFGGDEDDIDEFDPTGLDDGSDLSFTAPEVGKEEEDGEESAGEDEGKEGEDEAAAGDAGETDESGEEAEEEAAEAEGDDDGEASGEAAKPQGIPKHRFDEVNERRKAAEQELADLKAVKQAEAEGEAEVFDFDAKEDEYMELLLDGKTDEAKVIRREIRAAEKSEWQAETKHETRSEIQQTEAEEEVTTLSTEAEKMFPVFDENHEDYDSAITSKVLTYYRGYLAGEEFDNMPDAFVAALADVVEQYGLVDRYKVDMGDTPPPKKDDPPPKKDTANKEKLREQAHTPAIKAGQGADDAGVAAPDIMDMSDEDMDKLSEKQLARMRGDFI